MVGKMESYGDYWDIYATGFGESLKKMTYAIYYTYPIGCKHHIK